MTTTPMTPGDASRDPYSLPQPLIAGTIFHLPTGYPVHRETVIDHARRVQVVFVGETHDNPAAHRVQEDILRELVGANPGRVALGMEMFTPSQQPILDRWSAGELSEKEFLKLTDWYSTWGIDFDLYRDLLLLCRDQGINIIALNAERPLREALSRAPAEELPEELREQLPELDFNDPHYNAMIAAFHAGHPMDQRRIDGFYRVQTLWDETMAANLAAYLSTRDREHQVMVVAGGNHIQYGFGIPRRMFRRLPVTYLLIGTTETEASKDLDPSRFMDVDSPDQPLLPYHFLYVTAYEKLPRVGVRLGVMVTAETGPGVLINTIVPGSPAADQGLRVGDRLLKLEAEQLKDTFDLIYGLRQVQAGSTIRLTVLRDGEQREMQIDFSSDSREPVRHPATDRR